MRVIIVFISLLVTVSASAQRKSKDTLVRFFNGNLEVTTKKQAVFAGVIVRDVDGWNCLIYDDSMRIIVRGKYADEECKVKEGWFMYYYADGKHASGGRYTRNVRHENWKAWHENGQLKDSVTYTMGTIQGPAKSYHENGKLASEGNYVLGQFDGAWTFYHENGQPSTKELYKTNKLADLECFDTTGTSLGLNCGISRPPVIKGKYGGLEQYLADSIKPVTRLSGERVEGVVTVQFTITKEGQMQGFRILNSADGLLTKEVYRVITGIKEWYPAVSHNRLVDHTFTLNIPFFEQNDNDQPFMPMENPFEF